ncbi:MAG: ATP synthase F1 subunit delta [Candidatus Margulisiibacteriota bacterium]
MIDFDCEMLYSLTERENLTLKVESELFALYNFIKENFELKVTLDDPKFSAEFKIGLLNQLLPDYSEITRSLANQLIESGKASQLYKLSHAFSLLVAQKKQCLLGEMVCAHPATAAQLQAAETILTKKLGKKVRLKIRLDPDILGGLVIKILQGNIIDLSLANKLVQLRDQISAAV